MEPNMELIKADSVRLASFYEYSKLKKDGPYLILLSAADSNTINPKTKLRARNVDSCFSA